MSVHTELGCVGMKEEHFHVHADTGVSSASSLPEDDGRSFAETECLCGLSARKPPVRDPWIFAREGSLHHWQVCWSLSLPPTPK